MTSRVCVYVVAACNPSRPESQYFGISGEEVIDHHVEVELLGPGRIGPSRWRVIGG